MFQRLSSHIVDLVAAGVYVCALGFMVFGHEDKEAWQLILSFAMLVSVFALAFNYWRLLKITEAPISAIASAAQGYIELHGLASTTKLLKTPFHGIPCVWYRAWVYADRQEVAGSNKAANKISNTRLLEYVESDQSFQLRDSSGSCTVNPKGAEIIYSEKLTHHKNEHRYVEEYLPAGKRLYVLGYLDTLHEYNTIEAIERDISALLVSWKTNPIKLLLRFDHDRNGQIDMDEWEKARAEARHEVEVNHQMRAHNEMYTLAKPVKGQLFLISALSPQALRSRYEYWSWVHLGTLVLLLLAYVKLA
ncbi:MAG: hypothetical protein H7Z70_00195 [Bacteroidia bacterium]|nr:hypothetical protein [Methylotenera sp.]